MQSQFPPTETASAQLAGASPLLPGQLLVRSQPLVTDPALSPSRLVPKIVKAGNGECLELRGETRHILLDAHDTNGQIALSHTIMASGMGTPLYVHTREDEMFFVTQGQFSFQIADETFEVESGDFVFAPRHIAHSYQCTGEAAGKMLIWVASAGFEDFFRAQASATILNPTIMTEVAAQFGVRIGGDTSDLIPTAQPRVVRAGAESWIEAFGDRAHILVSACEVEGHLMLALGETPLLSGPPLHIHERCDEIFVILEGRYEFCIGDARVQAGPGDTIFAPRGIPHSFRVIAGARGRALLTTLPGDFESFFSECATLFASDLTPDALMPQIIDVSARYGITFVQPSA